MEKSEFKNLNEEPVLTPQMITNQLKKSSDFSFSQYVILGFFPSLYSYIKNRYRKVTIGYTNKLFPYYTFEYDKILITFQFPGIGAPLSGALLEESISLGGETFIFFGRTGVLKKSIHQDNIIIPTSALKDEGTSFHYDKSKIYSYPDKQLVSMINKAVKQYGYIPQEGRIWTTDGVYRETPSKVKRVKRKGCISVDMEASALFSIATFHKKRIAGFFIPSDYVGTAQWKQFKPQKNKVNPIKLLQLALNIIKQYSNQ